MIVVCDSRRRHAPAPVSERAGWSRAGPNSVPDLRAQDHLSPTLFADGACNAPHPSNAAMGLTALGASLALQGGRGTRTVPADQFFTIPDNDPRRENAREPDDILIGISVPTAPGVRSTYASVKEKAAFDWPLVSTAVALRPPWRSAWTEAVSARPGSCSARGGDRAASLRRRRADAAGARSR